MLCGTRKVVTLFALFLMQWLAPAVHAQLFTTGDVHGVVTDSSGAVIPGAKVQITSVGTGVITSATTDGNGSYSASALLPGDYELTVAMTGFANAVVHIVVYVGSNTAQNISLRVGTAGQSVVVQGASGLVDTTSSVIDTVLTPTQVASLPLNGREFADLASMAPGFYRSPIQDPTKKHVFQVGSAGMTGVGTNVFVDGAENFDHASGGNVERFTLEGIQEFSVTNGRFGADVGQSFGPTINVISKSGTNNVHGSAFYFLRNDELTANDYFEPVKAAFTHKQDGGSLGGPLRKDKTFLFGAYERIDEVDLGIVNTNGIYPQYDGSFALPFTSNLATVRLDQDFSDKARAFVRFGFDQNYAVENIGGIRAQSSGRTADNRIQSYVLGHTYTFSSNKLNTFVGQFLQFNNVLTPLNPGTPEIRRPDLITGQREGDPQSTKQREVDLRDDYAWVRGHHNFKLGGQYYRVWEGGSFDFGGNGSFRYFTDAPFTAPADELVIATSTVNFSVPSYGTNFVGAYFQDDWKVRPTLVLNLGLRYDWISDDGQGTSFVNPPLVPAGVRKSSKLNFEPRIGFAWDTTGKGKLVIRGGFGIYGDNPLLSIIEREFNGKTTANAIFLGPFYPSDPFPGLSPTQVQQKIFDTPQSPLLNLDNHLKSPYVEYSSIGTEYEFAPSFGLTVDYLHYLGLKQQGEIDKNVDPNGNVGTPFTQLAAEFGPAVAADYGAFATTMGNRFAKYNALQISVIKRFSQHYQFMASYALSHVVNDTGTGAAENPYNITSEIGDADLDQRHRFSFNGIFHLPYRFELSAISSIQSSFPLDIMSPFTVDGVSNDRPPGVTRNQGLRKDTPKLLSELNTFRAANGLGPITTTSPRSFGFAATDLRLSREFSFFNDRFSLMPMGEVFNVFNKPNFLSNGGAAGVTGVGSSGSGPSADILSSAFGEPVSTPGVLGPGGPRAFQLGIRCSF
jgi:hypothetical protein